MVDQHAGQDNFASLAANLHRLLRQLSGLFVIGLLRVADFQLGQQRQRIPVTVIGRFLRPVFGLLIITVTDVGIGKIVLRPRIAGFRLVFVLAAGIRGTRGKREQHQK